MRGFALLLLLISAPTAVGADLKVGFGEADITPMLGKKPVYIAGFGTNRLATKVHDPIMARAVVLDDGSKRLALVSVDLVGLFYPTVEAIRSGLPGFRHVLVSSTHNHEGPDTLGLWGRSPFQSGVDPDYLKQVVSGCISAVLAAEKKLGAVNAHLGTARGPELLHDGRKPEVKHDELMALKFCKADGTVAGIVVQWNCHPETLDDKNTELSADYVSTTVAVLQAKHKAPVVYFTGTVGGLMTSLKVPLKTADGRELKDGTFEKTEAYGRAVATLADKALDSSIPVQLTPFEVRVQPCLLPVENNIYRLAGQLGILNRPMYKFTDAADPKTWIVTADLSGTVAVKTEVGIIILGNLSIASIPGEIYPELVLGKIEDPAVPGADFPEAAKEAAIYPMMTSKHKMLIGLANDELGYFIPKRQWDDKAPFAYGLKKSQYGEINSIGPDAAGIISAAFRKAATAK